eukprot:TRINITY_DN4231_c0_g1_i2.p2 TRINITY_DN4231_c0_g1~~TRINITY_DN4231_c0_g1_i2.p2  ORF type:complete len:104 (-),score=10.78 TRINITY_DN4231_c0_g1_i2:232-543(-)
MLLLLLFAVLVNFVISLYCLLFVGLFSVFVYDTWRLTSLLLCWWWGVIRAAFVWLAKMNHVPGLVGFGGKSCLSPRKWAVQNMCDAPLSLFLCLGDCFMMEWW